MGQRTTSIAIAPAYTGTDISPTSGPSPAVLARERAKNLTREPIERSGMCWAEGMAESIVQPRAISLSRSRDAYWSFHIEKAGIAFIPTARLSI